MGSTYTTMFIVRDKIAATLHLKTQKKYQRSEDFQILINPLDSFYKPTTCRGIANPSPDPYHLLGTMVTHSDGIFQSL